MASFMGGSAFAMASQIAEGYILVTAATLRKYTVPERTTLIAEVEKIERELRGEIIPTDETAAIQKKNRKLSRLRQVKMMIKNLR